MNTTRTVALCFCVALFEGMDIIATGLTGPQLREVFALSPERFGQLGSASTFGLFLGAVAGGWIADRIGRKRVLIASMLVFGAMTLAITGATSTTMLFTLRFLTGLGLGGAMPNLIALCAESGPARLRTTLVTLMFSGVPIGGAIGGAVMLWGGGNVDWRILFQYGGAGPLVLAAVLAFLLPESTLFQAARAERGPGIFTTLFGGGRALSTVYLALAFFCTLIAIYLLINWLPILLVGKGLTRPQAAMTMILFNLASGVGAIILGRLMDVASGKAVMVATYAGVIASLLGLMYAFRLDAPTVQLLGVTGAAAGFFVVGAQLVLYGMAPRYYPTPIRATGVGSCVAAGRVGSVVGPLVAGQMLGAGATAGAVVTSLIPFVVVAGISALLLVPRPTVAD